MSALIGKGDRFEVYDDEPHGFRVVRLSDKTEALFHGDDSVERFRDQFNGEESPENENDFAVNAICADDVGEWAEEEGEFPPVRKKCLVHGCTNHNDQGVFVGPLCFPCHAMLTTGKVERGATFVHRLHQAAGKAAEDLGNWLADNTEQVFEEEPEIDGVRTELLDALEKV